MRFLYLHGFASSPASRKSRYFDALLSAQGIRLECPALDQDDFPHLTISNQLRLVEELLSNEPVVLIGSSMGGYLAALYASRHPEVTRMVLLAPALGFAPRWRQMNGEATFQAWQSSGWMQVFHYGSGTMRPIHFGLYEDALRYPASPDFPQPTLIFHGTNDPVVPVQFSRDFAATHPNAQLTELPSGHELTDVLDEIGDRSMRFLLGA